MNGSLPDEEKTKPDPTFGSIGGSAIRGTILSQFTRIVLSLVTLPIIARQLSPRDYGAFALLLLFITFLDNLRDFGITTAIMGAKKFDEKTRSNIFWISSIGGLVVFVVGFLTSNLILKFLNIEKYELELKFLLLTLFLNGISNIFVLNFRRILDFNRVIAIELLSSSISVIAALISALNGLGIWTLVIQSLTLSSLTLVLSVLYSDWKPVSPSKSSELKILYSNGFFFFAVQYLDQFTQQFPTFILGKSGNISDAGNFDRGRHLQNMLNSYFNIPIRQIGVPIVRARYHLEGALESVIEKVHLLTLHILLPVFSLFFCQAELIVRILYGDQYTEVSPIFRILMVAAMVQTSNYIRVWISIILNQGKNHLKRTVIAFFVHVICIFPVASSGVLQVTLGYLLASFISMLIGFWFFRKIEEVNIQNLLIISLKFLCIYASLSVALWLLQLYLMSELPILLVIFLEFFIIVIAALAHLKYSNFLHDFKYILKNIFLKK
jgi:PST family polysaccharide transporter